MKTRNQRLPLVLILAGLMAPWAAMGQGVSLLTTITNPSPAANVLFGRAVAAIGSDRVIVSEIGKAHLLSASGTLLTTFTNPNPAFQNFGLCVAVLGSDRVIVGAPDTAYLFSINGALLATFTNPAPPSLEGEGNGFGNSLAAVGSDRVVIGAPLDDRGAENSGVAYVFSTNGAWITTITNPTPAGDDYFGNCVAAVGIDRVLIGAPLDSTAASTAGEAYLFSINGTLLTTITNPTPGGGEEFAISVAAFGTDRLLIGADSDNPQYTGGAYLFSTNGTLLTSFTNPASAQDFFGFFVAAVGTERVLIGTYQIGGAGPTDAGVAYLFSTNGTLLTTITNPTPAQGDLFGFGVAALGNDRVLIGAHGDDTGATNSGAAYVFSLETVASECLVTFTNPAPAESDRFGYSVAAVGSDRVLIGAIEHSTPAPLPGAAYLYSINGTLLTTFTNPTPHSADFFGYSLAAVGTDRVFIGAPGDYDITTEEHVGAAYLFTTDGTLLTTIANPNPNGRDEFGVSVAVVGSDHVLIGARSDLENSGAAYLFTTNGTLLTTFTNPPPFTFESAFGFSVAALGSDRVLISAPNTYVGDDDSVGRAYLFNTNGTLLTTFTKPSARPGDEFGIAVAVVGSDRVLISSGQADEGLGAAYLFSTNGALITTFTNPTPFSGDDFGWSLAAVGSDRVLIGAYKDNAGTNAAGTAYLFSTNGTLLTTFTNPTPAVADYFGYSLTAVGTDRVFIGAYRDATGAYEAGAAYLFCIEPFSPRLSVTHSGGSVIVSWPNAIGFTLQSTLQLSPPAWADVTNAPALIGGNWAVTNSLSGSNKFYRLRKP